MRQCKLYMYETFLNVQAPYYFIDNNFFRYTVKYELFF